MTRRKAEPRWLVLAIATWAVAAHAQDVRSSGVGTTIQPRVGLMQTWTDNLRLDDRNKDAALITTLSPGISVYSNTGAVRGSLDYSLNGIAYTKSEESARIQNSLVGSLQAELISRTLFVDARATIGQQNTSALGMQSAPTLGSQGTVSSLVNENQRETGTLTVSPTWRGIVGGLATYELRGDFTRTEVRGSSLGDSRGRGGSLRISEWNAGVLGWWVQATTQEVTATSVASNRSTVLRAGLDYRPDPDWFFSINAGRERNNFLGNGDQDGATGGLTAQWTPTPRTRVGADWQHHNYGDSRGLNFEHRMARSVWRFSDTQSVMLGNIGAQGGVRSNYDQFFLLFASLEPDPVKRDVLVRSFLQSQGLSPDAPVANGFLSAGPSRMRSQSLSVALQGVRQTLSAQFSRTVTGRLGNNLNGGGDLATNARIEQRSYTLSASHQLTPVSGISVTLSRQESTGDSQSAKLNSVFANWNSRLGVRLSAQLGARHSRFEGVTPYTENAVYANLTQQF